MCMRVCTGVQSNYQQPWGNPLIPAHEFTLPDRLIPYEITGHPRRGLGLGAASTYALARARGILAGGTPSTCARATHDACGTSMQN